jgi:hypothetical protein
MNFKPYDYQEPMIEHLVNNDHAALFAGMGLGKTACTLEALQGTCPSTTEGSQHGLERPSQTVGLRLQGS